MKTLLTLLALTLLAVSGSTVSHAQVAISAKGDFYKGAEFPALQVPVILKTKSGQVIAQTKTDAQGNFSFSNVPAGTYIILTETLMPALDGASKDPGRMKFKISQGGSVQERVLDTKSMATRGELVAFGDFMMGRSGLVIGTVTIVK